MGIKEEMEKHEEMKKRKAVIKFTFGETTERGTPLKAEVSATAKHVTVAIFNLVETLCENADMTPIEMYASLAVEHTMYKGRADDSE